MNTETPGGPELGRIVVGVDSSEHARSAALWAAAEADRRSQPLRIVYGADLDRLMRFASFETLEHIREAGRVLLVETATAVEERFPNLTVTRELSRKEPVSALLSAVGPQDTIVVGSRGHGGFGSLMLGSVGLGVAAGSAVPVIVVRGETERPQTGMVTAGVRDESDADWLGYAAREAQLRKASLHLLSVWNLLAHVGSVATMLDDVDELARRRVDRVSALTSGIRDEFPGLAVTSEVETGRSAAALLAEASRHADLLVMGRRRPPMGLGSSLGRVAHALLHHSSCPVEIVPRTAGTKEEE